MLLLEVRQALRQVADPAKAPVMQAYMKSTMPYHGVPAPIVAKVCKAAFADLQFDTAAHWQALVLELWRGAQFREERYSAMQLTGDKRARPFQTPAAMQLYEELVVTGAWWDFVDDIASHRIGPILAAHPDPMRRMMLSWSRSNHLWKRRCAILCQLGPAAICLDRCGRNHPLRSRARGATERAQPPRSTQAQSARLNMPSQAPMVQRTMS